MTQDQDISQESNQEPKKKAVRRTRAAKTAESAEIPAMPEAKEAAAAADGAEAPVKKRRTRAVKAAEQPVAEPAAPAADAEAAPKPRRARATKKSEAAPAEDAEPADAAPAAEGAPRSTVAEAEAAEAKPAGTARRRAVKKTAEPTETSAEASAPSIESLAVPTAEVSADSPAASAPEEAAPARKPRGRARKTAPDQEHAPAVAEAGSEQPPAEQAPVEIPSAQALAAVSDPSARPAPPSAFEDDGVVTHILPFPAELDADGRNRRRRPRRHSKKADGPDLASFIGPQPEVSLYDVIQPPLPSPDGVDVQRSKRHRTRRKRKPGGQPAPFQPEAFADMYPSAVLGMDDHFVFSDDFEEDDGPQPALPGQPSLALPPAPLEDEDLEALDEAVNGNRVDAPRQPEVRGRRGGKAKGPGAPSRPAPASRETPAEREAAAPDEAPAVSTGKRVLYMSVVPEEQVEVVITDNGQVTEYFVEMAHQAKIRGNIYKGVINNVDSNLQAAFVNFGSGKNGFLQIDEVHPEYWLTPHDSGRGPKYPPIQKVLKVGQEVLVQVVKEPSGSKGAFLTTWVSLAGRFLVLTPGQEQIGVSRKVEDPAERTRLKELLAGIEPGEDMGVIIRTASEGASKTSIQKDLQFLKRLWKDIRKRATTEKSPCLIYQEADLASRSVRDYLAEDIREIWVDNEATLESIRETVGLLFPRRQDMVKLHQDPRQTLWERFNLQRQLEEVTSREVVLPSGGRLVFDQTEALMAIDINSGKTQGKSNFEAMVFRTNMEAAEAIARHLRLRDIGGQVVIDFIEMRDRNHCRDVEKTLRNAMRLDRARHDVGRMSSFGLLELVRQRTGTSAISISSEPCPYCRGTGVRRNMEWQALHSMRDLQCKLSKNAPSENGKNKKGDPSARNGASNPGVFVYETEPELAMYLLNRKRDRLSELEARFGLRIEIHPKA